jgi:hypothetical protein
MTMVWPYVKNTAGENPNYRYQVFEHFEKITAYTLGMKQKQRVVHLQSFFTGCNNQDP